MKFTPRFTIRLVFEIIVICSTLVPFAISAQNSKTGHGVRNTTRSAPKNEAPPTKENAELAKTLIAKLQGKYAYTYARIEATCEINNYKWSRKLDDTARTLLQTIFNSIDKDIIESGCPNRLADAIMSLSESQLAEVTVDNDALFSAIGSISNYKDKYSRYYAAKILCRIHDQRASFFIYSAFRDELNDIRKDAAIVLNYCAPPDMLNDLVSDLNDQRSDVRIAATNVLAVLGGPSGANAITAKIHARECNLEGAAGSMSKELLSSIYVLTTDPDPFARECAAKALGRSNDLNADRTLVRMLKDQDKEVVSQAEYSLGHGGGSAVIELVNALHDSSPDIRIRTVNILRSMNYSWTNGFASTAAEGFNLLARDSDDDVRKALVESSSNHELARRMSSIHLALLGDSNSLIKRQAAHYAANTLLSEFGYLNADGFIDPEAQKKISAKLIELIDAHDLVVISGAYEYYIKVGRYGWESILCEALSKYGNVEMAASFLNSGNDTLAASGEQWAQANKYVKSSVYGSAVKWHSQ